MPYIHIYTVYQDNITALMKAAGCGHTSTCEILIKHGADVNAVDRVSFTDAYCATIVRMRMGV